MRLKTTKTNVTTWFYIIKDYTINKKRTTKIIESLGNIEQVKQKAGDKDYMEWINEYINNLNKLDKEENRTISLNLNPNKELEKDKQSQFNGGYLFLQDIYYKLGINNICNTIKDKYQFRFDFDNILSRLIYSRIIYPASKLSTLELSKKFIEQPNFNLHQIYRALEVIAKENDYIQSELYKNSLKLSKRNTEILYYDCTNYFFEIEQAEGIKQYGKAKQKQGKPLVQMGLFMDGDGIPLAFNITPGNRNEQITLKPIEKQIIKDFELSKFVVCTDAGLASTANRKFNDIGNRGFITTQSIKKLKDFLKEWALEPTGWRIPGGTKTININDLDDMIEKLDDEEQKKKWKNIIFYKERWIKEDGLEQRLIISYSIKYRNYQAKIRQGQIERAKKLIDSRPEKIGKVNQNDFKRFILKTSVTKDGEVAEDIIYELDENLINKESIYDGFYGVCTNLEDDIAEIIKTNRRRWEIEESFRIMKSEFEARPVYLSRDDRITAHFTTCILALIVYRYLEKALENGATKELKEELTVSKIIGTLREYNFKEYPGDGYTPSYTRTDITDHLHNKFEFRTDFEIVSDKKMKKICKETKI